MMNGALYKRTGCRTLGYLFAVFVSFGIPLFAQANLMAFCRDVGAVLTGPNNSQILSSVSVPARLSRAEVMERLSSSWNQGVEIPLGGNTEGRVVINAHMENGQVVIESEKFFHSDSLMRGNLAAHQSLTRVFEAGLLGDFQIIRFLRSDIETRRAWFEFAEGETVFNVINNSSLPRNFRQAASDNFANQLRLLESQINQPGSAWFARLFQDGNRQLPYLRISPNTNPTQIAPFEIHATNVLFQNNTIIDAR